MEEESAADCERERERRRLASLRLEEVPAASHISPSFTREKEIEKTASLRLEESPAVSQISTSLTRGKEIEKTAEEVWIIDRSLLKIEKKLENDLFAAKYKGVDVCVQYLKHLNVEGNFKVRDFVKLRELSHEHVIEIIGISTDPLNQFVVYEPVCGTIKDALHKEHIMSDPIKVALDVAEGMQYLHHNSIILDPVLSTVFMTNDGVIKLSGYGLLQRRSSNEFSICSDVKAYGFLLWEMISKERPMEYLLEHAQKPLDEGPSGAMEPQLSFGDKMTKTRVFDPLIKGIPKTTDQKLVGILEKCLCLQPPTFDEIIRFLKPVASEGCQKQPRRYHYR